MGNRAERELGKNNDPLTAAIITSLNNELAYLNRQKKLGLISGHELKVIRQPLVGQLHQVMETSGRKPIRTKGNLVRQEDSLFKKTSCRGNARVARHFNFPLNATFDFS